MAVLLVPYISGIFNCGIKNMPCFSFCCCGKHHNCKQTGEGKDFVSAYICWPQSIMEVRAGAQGKGMAELCLLAWTLVHVQVAFLYNSNQLLRDGAALGGQSPPTSVILQDTSLQTRPHSVLIKASIQLSSHLPGNSKLCLTKSNEYWVGYGTLSKSGKNSTLIPSLISFFLKLKIDFSIQYIVISFPSPSTSLILPTSPPIQRFILFLCICNCVLYVYVHGCRCLWKPEKNIKFPRTRTLSGMSYWRWVLATKLGSPAGAASKCNCWSISPILNTVFYFFCHY